MKMIYISVKQKMVCETSISGFKALKNDNIEMLLCFFHLFRSPHRPAYCGIFEQ